VAEIDAALVSAAANARALETLGKDPKSYDRQSGQRLLRNARESLDDAKSRVTALRSSASKEDRKQLDDLASRITRAGESLDRVASRIDRPKDVADNAGKAYSELNAAVKPLKNVARAMGTGIEVVGPTG
jgi:chromosome segregation ATPase